MPKQTRYAIRQKLDSVERELDKAQIKLVEVGQLYKELHPEEYNKFCYFVTCIEELKKALDKFSKSV